MKLSYDTFCFSEEQATNKKQINKVHIKNGSVKPKERDFKMCEESMR